MLSATLAMTAVYSTISAQSVSSLGYDLTPQSMTTAEPTPVPTKRPSSNIEPLQWGQSSPAPADAPNSVRRLQLWTCCKPDPTETTEEHVNSKLTHEPTEYPTPEPTASVDSDFCGHGLTGCSYYANECEDYCACDWDRGFETCGECNLGEATVCISCLPGYTLSGGECHANGAFTGDEEVHNVDDESGINGDFLMGIGIGFVFFAAMAVCVGMMVFLWRRNKAVVSVPDIDHEDIKLTDDQQLEAVDNTTIELNESVDLHETKPIGTDE